MLRCPTLEAEVVCLGAISPYWVLLNAVKELSAAATLLDLAFHEGSFTGGEIANLGTATATEAARRGTWRGLSRMVLLISLTLFVIGRISGSNDMEFWLPMRCRHPEIVSCVGHYCRIGAFKFTEHVLKGDFFITSEVFVGTNLSAIFDLKMGDKEVDGHRVRERNI